MLRFGFVGLPARTLAMPLVWLLVSLISLLAVPTTALALDAVCAEVRIEIRQKVSLERQAFDATLRIHNGLTTSSIRNIAVDLVFEDEAGNPVVVSSDPDAVGASFFVRLDELDGITGVDGSGVVEAGTDGTARWLIIPAATAGGMTPAGRIYAVGAHLTYVVNDDVSEVDVVPEIITVVPQPLLDLDYFLAGDVYADDPFTVEEEPAVPFTLGVRVKNAGAGTGRNVRIESAQPEIIDNEQGLLIDFSILGGFVDDGPTSPSLLLEFGDIDPGQSRMGRWLMETTLSGRFVDIEASYTHAPELGGALTSLFAGPPRSHLLVRDVLVDLPGRDGVRDYLARDIDILRVYESSGADSVVADLSEEVSVTPLGQETWEVAVQQTFGMVYIQVPDPSAGAGDDIVVTRADGRVMLAENAWKSKTRNETNGWDHFINIFDVEGGDTYVVANASVSGSARISGTVYLDEDGNGQQDGGEPGLDDVGLLLTGETPFGMVSRETRTAQDGSFVFDSLFDGEYELIIGDVDGLANGTHHAGVAGGVVDGDRISGISLQPGTQASGYALAKIHLDLDRAADLSVASLLADPTPIAGQQTSIEVKTENLGPQAVSAQTLLMFPDDFEIDFTQGQNGFFSEDTGAWNHGVMIPGQVDTVTIVGRYTESGSRKLAVSVVPADAGVMDPIAANNHGELEITVQEQDNSRVEVEMSDPGGLLLWADCRPEPSQRCNNQRAIRWEAVLSASGLRHQVEAQRAAFLRSLRSGDWSVVWVDEPGSWLDDALRNELREHVRRGGALFLSGERQENWISIEAWAGAAFGEARDGTTHDVILGAGGLFPTAELSVSGISSNFELDGGRIVASYADGAVAGVASSEESGRSVVVLGMDFLSGLEGLDDPADVMAGAATTIETRIFEVLPVGQRVRFAAAIHKEEDVSAAPALRLRVPSLFGLIDHAPVPTSVLSSLREHQIRWDGEWSPDADFRTSSSVRAPWVQGEYELVAEALSGIDAQASMAVQVRDYQSQSAMAWTAISAAVAWNTEDERRKAVAAKELMLADAAMAEERFDDAIDHLLGIAATLDEMTEESGSGAALEISRAYAIAARMQIFSDGFGRSP